MPKNVMKLLKPSPHRQRNDFDLSHRHVFDLNFGELLPATCIETVPGDNITLHVADLLRNIPFVSSPFLRAKQHIDVWFVPYRDLWHQFDAFITKREEPVSSAFKGAKFCPYFEQYGLKQAVESGLYDITGRLLSDRSYYLLQLLGYGDVNSHAGASDKTFKVNPFRLAAYNYIWYNEYRQNYYDDGMRHLYSTNYNAAALFNFDDLDCSTEATANIWKSSESVNQTRLPAMVQMRYRTWKKDLFTGILPNTQFGNVSTVSAGSLTGLTAEFVGTQGTINWSTGSDLGLHRYYDASNNQPVPLSDMPDYDPDHQNRVLGQQYLEPVMESDLYGSRTVLKPKYDEDTDNISGFNSVKTQSNHGVLDGHTHGFSFNFTPQGTVNLNSTSGSLEFDVLSLRKAEALQIWRENALRAGNHIKDNMMAHYGVASDFQDHRPTYLGSVSAPLNITDIAATANSSSGINDTVGDIAGKGISSMSEKVFKFHAKEFGVIMVLMSVLPEAEYDANGIERNNQLLEPSDFFVPEYENLGLEAVSSINIGPSAHGYPSENSVIGYAPRYFGYKQKMDKVFGEFVGNGIFRSWSSQRSDVSYYYSQSQLPSTPLSFLYVNPALFDANFNVGISVSPQCLVDAYFDVDAVRPMSVTGMPFS